MLDPAGESLPFNGRVRFAGLEGEGGDLPAGREHTRGLSGAFPQSRESGAEGHWREAIGWSMSTHRTDHPAEPALLGLWTMLGDRAA